MKTCRPAATSRAAPYGRLLLLTLLAIPSCARKTPPPNVLVIVVDTLRADRVVAQGDRITTPRLDEFANEALRFTHLQSPRAKTTPAVASLLTGLYPHDHGVRDLTTPLPHGTRTLAHGLKEAGWRTGAIVGNYVLKDELSGLADGFDLWVEDMPELQGVPPEDVPQRGAVSLTDGALFALGLADRPAESAGPERPFVREGKPWFLYLHYMDPHGLYAPPPEHDVFTSTEPRWIPPSSEPRADGTGGQWIAEYNLLPSDRDADGRVDAARVIDRYDGEVHAVDAEIGRLLDVLRASGELENTLVLIVADHGESLGEHDYWFEHGRYAYEATCRVPGILRVPDALAHGDPVGVRDGDLSLCDLAPTILDLLRLPRLSPAGDGPRGTSRTRLLELDEAPRPVFCEKVERAEKSQAVQTKAARIGDWKFLRRYTHLPDLERPGHDRLVLLSEELFDLANDPLEAFDLSQAPPPDAPIDRLRAELLRFSTADEHFERLARELQDRREQLGRDDPETLRIFRALGY
ncbi:MAG: sulfatase [Planctomycetes bacterium]|nr:sulfatase [Planctomycetota bacterium]